jgi:hypothetical protein
MRTFLSLVTCLRPVSTPGGNSLTERLRGGEHGRNRHMEAAGVLKGPWRLKRPLFVGRGYDQQRRPLSHRSACCCRQACLCRV